MTARKVKAAPVKRKTRNLLFPGRPNYKGPPRGYFSFLHHQQMFEETKANAYVMQRVKYVRDNKPDHEKKRRLHQMMYLGGCEVVRAMEKLKRVSLLLYPFGYEVRRPIDQAVDHLKAKMRPLVLEYIKTHIPDVVWDEEQMTIFPTGARPDHKHH